MLPFGGLEGGVEYDLSASINFTIPSQGKGIAETGIAIALPSGVYAWIAPCSRLTIQNFIDFGAGVIDLDYRLRLK